MRRTKRLPRKAASCTDLDFERGPAEAGPHSFGRVPGRRVKHRTFFWFILPSALAMLLFIALPVISVAIQSLYIEHEKVMVTVESCGPFGCTKDTHVAAQKTLELQKAAPLGRFNGLGTSFTRSHLAIAEIGAILSINTGFADAASRIYALPL